MFPVFEDTPDQILSMAGRGVRAVRDLSRVWMKNATTFADRVLQKSGPRRRRVGAALVILGLHLLVLAWLSVQSVSPLTTSTFLVDLSLEPGSGGGAYMEPRPTVRPSADQPDREEISEAETTPPATDDETIPAIETAAEPPVTDMAALAQVEAAFPAPASETSDAVLALVEALLGASGTEVSATEVIVQSAAVPTGPALAVAPGGGCDIGASLALAIGSSPEMQNTLATMPREARSVANAVQVWDGSWIDPADARAEPAFAAVRLVILEAIEAAPEPCRNQPLTGPRFVVVPEGENSATILVVGSGTWRWADLPAQPRFIWPPWFSRSNR